MPKPSRRVGKQFSLEFVVVLIVGTAVIAAVVFAARQSEVFEPTIVSGATPLETVVTTTAVMGTSDDTDASYEDPDIATAMAEATANPVRPAVKPTDGWSQMPPPPPAPTLVAGIDNGMHQGPFPATEFLVENFWQGPVGEAWIAAYAGATKDAQSGQVELGAIRLYRVTATDLGGLHFDEIGTFEFPEIATTVKVTAVNGVNMQLQDDEGRIVVFDLLTHAFRGIN